VQELEKEDFEMLERILKIDKGEKKDERLEK
jgi:hypothetical protein